jgi:hypothetical protein
MRSKEGRIRQVRAHRIVAEAWIGSRPAGREIAHWDGDPANNRPQNLRYATPTENTDDRRRHGTLLAGERHGCARLTEADVRRMRADYAAGGVSQRQLAGRYGVTQATVWAILAGRLWAHLTDSRDDVA